MRSEFNHSSTKILNQISFFNLKYKQGDDTLHRSFLTFGPFFGILFCKTVKKYAAFAIFMRTFVVYDYKIWL